MNRRPSTPFKVNPVTSTAEPTVNGFGVKLLKTRFPWVTVPAGVPLFAIRISRVVAWVGRTIIAAMNNVKAMVKMLSFVFSINNFPFYVLVAEHLRSYANGVWLKQSTVFSSSCAVC